MKKKKKEISIFAAVSIALVMMAWACGKKQDSSTKAVMPDVNSKCGTQVCVQ